MWMSGKEKLILGIDTFMRIGIKLIEDKMAETSYMSCSCDSGDKINWIKWNLIIWFKRV